MVIVVTTTTIAPAMRTGFETQMRSRASLIKAYWAKLSAKSVALLAQGRTLAGAWYSRLAAYVPPPVMMGAAAAVVATKAGYHFAVDTAARVAHGIRRTAGWVLRLVEHGWIAAGNLASSLVGLVSKPAAAKVDDFFATVSCKGLSIARSVDYAVGAGIEISRSVLKSDLVTRVANVAASLVVAGVLLSYAAPTLGGSLTGLPVVGSFIQAGMNGTWNALRMIALAIAIASAAEVLNATVIKTPDPAVSVPATIKGFVAEAKAAGATSTASTEAPAPVVETPAAADEAAEDTTKSTEDVVMATVASVAPEVIESNAAAEADAAFKDATAHIGSSKNKHRDSKRR